MQGPLRFSIKDFGAGLYSDPHPTAIPDGAASECRNVVFDRHSVRTRPGMVEHSTYTDAGGGRSMGEWEPQVAADYLRLVTARSTLLEATDAADQTTAPHIQLDTTIHATNRVRFAQLGKWLYFVDSDGWPKRCCFDAGDPDAVDVLDTFNMQAPPVVVLSATAGTDANCDFLDPGTYRICLGQSNSNNDALALGQIVSVSVPPDTYKALVVTIPDVEAWTGWTASVDCIEVWVKTPYNANPNRWLLVEHTDPSLPGPFLWVTGIGEGITIFDGNSGTGSFSAVSITQVERTATQAIYTSAAHKLVVGQGATIAGIAAGGGGAGYDGYRVIEAITADTFKVADATGITAPAAVAPSGTTTVLAQVDIEIAGPASLGRDDYIPGPPKAATIVCEWQSRMVYVGRKPFDATGAADTLYISNLLDPTETPWETIINPDADLGLYITVGSDGEEITGLHVGPGSLLTVIKKRGLWLVDGDGPSSFRCLRASGAHGCISHENIAEADGRLLWFSGDTVYGFDGGNFADLCEDPSTRTAKIRQALQAYSEAEKALSFAVYDPQKHWYVLYVPTSQWWASMGCDAFYLDLRTGAWAKWDRLWLGSALYAAHAATPATYGAAGSDFAGVFPTAATYLYRLFEGESDNARTIESEWWSREFEEPNGQYKSIERIHAQVKCLDPVLVTMRLGIRTNESHFDTANSGDLDPLPGAGQPRMLRYRPPLLPDVGTYRVGASWTGTAALEMTRLDVELLPKGLIK